MSGTGITGGTGIGIDCGGLVKTAATGGFAISGRTGVVFAGITGSLVIRDCRTNVSVLGSSIIVTGRALGLIAGITGSSTIGYGRTNALRLFFGIVATG